VSSKLHRRSLDLLSPWLAAMAALPALGLGLEGESRVGQPYARAYVPWRLRCARRGATFRTAHTTGAAVGAPRSASLHRSRRNLRRPAAGTLRSGTSWSCIHTIHPGCSSTAAPVPKTHHTTVRRCGDGSLLPSVALPGGQIYIISEEGAPTSDHKAEVALYLRRSSLCLWATQLHARASSSSCSTCLLPRPHTPPLTPTPPPKNQQAASTRS
jgi:hypothetical protein